ncbi:MAG: nitrogen fixation protein [Sulfuricella sp.]|nr:nitrogen fixation protein [Sulfuricella sp.]
MKIAVTSQNRKTITGHAGKCRKFWIYEIVDKKIVNKTLLELALEQSFHESHAAGPHPLDGINVLISGGAGKGLIRRLNNMGIQGLVTPETDPDSAVAAFLNGTLKLGQAEPHEGHGEHLHGAHGCCH